eukprot:g39209.t1
MDLANADTTDATGSPHPTLSASGPPRRSLLMSPGLLPGPKLASINLHWAQTLLGAQTSLRHRWHHSTLLGLLTTTYVFAVTELFTK